MTFGLTPEGFNKMRLADIKEALEDAFIAQFGDINIDPQSVFGQEIGVLSKAIADFWEDLQDVYFSQYPNSASGVALDNVVQLNGITRLGQTQTVVTGTADGVEGTYIPINSQAKLVSTNDVFYAQTGGSITRSNADIVKVNVDALAGQIYTVVLSNQSFSYSKPRITFSNVGDIFVAGNSIVITINGVVLPAVPYNASSNQTLSDVRDAIGAFPAVGSSLKTNPDIILITPAVGQYVVINSISITGGATQASYVIDYRVPLTFNEVTAALTAIINNGSFPWVPVDNMDNTLTITATNPAQPFSASVGFNLSIPYVASPITFLSVDYGPIPAPVNTLTNIITPIGGWNSINNYVAGSTGRLTETDAQLRIRRANSIKLLSAATVESIRSHLQQNVEGVTSALVFENRTLIQEPILIVFPAPFDPADVVTVTYNTSSTFMVTYNTSQAQTMDDICAQFLLLDEVATATHGGTGDQTITLTMKVLNDLIVNLVVTDVSAQTATIKGGRPPKSFEAVVEGGTDEDIANEIWLTKPAGIETFGNTSFTITDSMGNSQVIYFSRPTEIFIWVQVALTLYTEETFPVNGLQLVADAIYNYGSNLGIGIDVLFQRVLAQIFQVPGISSGSMTIAATNNISDTPSFGTADISIQDNEVSVWSLDRINVSVV